MFILWSIDIENTSAYLGTIPVLNVPIYNSIVGGT